MIDQTIKDKALSLATIATQTGKNRQERSDAADALHSMIMSYPGAIRAELLSYIHIHLPKQSA